MTEHITLNSIQVDLQQLALGLSCLDGDDIVQLVMEIDAEVGELSFTVWLRDELNKRLTEAIENES